MRRENAVTTVQKSCGRTSWFPEMGNRAYQMGQRIMEEERLTVTRQNSILLQMTFSILI